MRLTKWLNMVVSVGIVFPGTLLAQNLTLTQVRQQSRENYPAIKQKDLIQRTASLSIQNLGKGYLPQIALNGQASYQSDVTQVNVPIPGFSFNPLSKDQYKATADVDQILFDGGVIYHQQQLQRLNAKIEDQKIEVELYKLRERIDQIYLGVLLLDERLKQVGLVKADIQTGIHKTRAMVNNGVAFRSNLNSLEAESLKVEQRSIELQSNRKGLISALELFVGKPLDENVQLDIPKVTQTAAEVKRPELSLYQKQMDLTGQQRKLLSARNLPKLNLFAQGGYGRPGLNMLQDQFDWFYIAGIRANWSLNNLYTFKKERQLLDVNRQSIQLQQEVFMLNTNSQLRQQEAEIDKLKQFIATDKEIIALREKVKIAANAQLENQVISASDYIREVNAEDQARQDLILHEIQLLQAIINYNTISGN